MHRLTSGDALTNVQKRAQFLMTVAWTKQQFRQMTGQVYDELVRAGKSHDEAKEILITMFGIAMTDIQDTYDMAMLTMPVFPPEPPFPEAKDLDK